MSKSIKKNRALAFESQDGKCCYCGFPMWIGSPGDYLPSRFASKPAMNRLRCTAEHKVARVDGGPNSRRNIVAACWFCNQNRHRRPNPLSSEKYAVFVQSRVRAGKWHPPVLHTMRMYVQDG